MRFSKQRQAVLDAVISSDKHLNADEIHKIVKQKIPNISLGTVYRNLNELVSIGKIKRIVLKNGNDKFDKTTSNHNHLYCEVCGKLIDVNYKINDADAREIEAETGFKITDCNFNIKGICSNCRKERN